MFEKQIDVTVFTPTYNRAYIIPKLYESLRMQTFRNFEWVVINDGSTDNTDELFSKWLKEDNFFTIKYIKVENGGKHRAINKGVQNANGRLFFIVDSDDYLTDDALLKIKETENSIPTSEKEKFAGVCGQKGKTKTEPIGTSFNGECLDILSIDRLKYGICGDKAEAFYTSVMKRYPFPEFEYEKFLSECLVWNEMAMDGLKLRFFNDIIYICEYRNDGLTAQGDNLFVKNPKGWGGVISQAVELKQIKGFEKWSLYLKYFETQKKKIKFGQIARNLNCNPIVLYNRLFWMRVFYRIYSK